MIKRALVSVSDKKGIVDFCKGLVDCGLKSFPREAPQRLLRKRGLK